MSLFRQSPIFKELKKLEKEEAKVKAQEENCRELPWKDVLENKIPAKTFANLKRAFGKAFEIVFDKGNAIIEKTYQKEELKKDFLIRDYAFDLKGKRKELRKIKSAVAKRNMKNLTISTVEGAGLGVLGIGLPDIIMFTGMILRGTYETALHYGFEYDSLPERFFILKLLETSVSKGELWSRCNEQVDKMLMESPQVWISKEENIARKELEEQIKKTGDAFAVDMLAAKFLQGLPLVGMLAGFSNPVYYHRIMKYVEMKYRKRYLLQKAGTDI